MFKHCCFFAVVLAATVTGPASAERLEGKVVEDHSGNPLASVGVRIFDIGRRSMVADLDTDGVGHFQAAGLRVGDYRIEAAKPGYVSATVRLRLAGGESSLTTVIVRLVHCGAITGQVTDPQGNPVRGANVVALPKPAEGGPLRPFANLAPGNYVPVDERGQYRLYNLIPGQYAVAISSASFNPGGSSGLHFYPDNARPQFLSISGGEEYRGIDFTLLPTPLYGVSGTAVLPLAGGRSAVSLFSVEQPALPYATAWTESDGSFRLDGVPPGSYDVVASGPAMGYSGLGVLLGPEPVFGRTHIEVIGEDITGIPIALSKGRSVSFVLRAPGSQKPMSVCPTSARLTLVPLEALGSMRRSGTEVGFDKPVRIENVAPGRYEVVVSNLGDECYATSNPVIDLTGASTADPVAVEIAPAGSIRGRLNAGSVRPMDFAVVLLASAPSGDPQGAQIAYPDAESRFAFPIVRPGRYRIAAQRADDAPKSRWVPDLSRMFEIEVPAGTPTEIELPVPAEDRKKP